jgi:MFS family permease
VSPGSRLYTRHFWFLYLAHFAVAFTYISFVLLPLRIEELGGNEIDIGWIAAAGVGAGVVIRWLSGHLSDRIGRRWIMLVAAALHALACFLFIGVDSLWPGFYLVRMLHGLADGALFGAFFTAASDLAPPDRRAECIAVFGTSGMIANWVGPFCGEHAIAAGGFTAFFVLCGVVGIVAVMLVALIPETGGRVPPVGFERGWLRNPALLLAFAFTLIFGLVIGAYIHFLAPHLERVGGMRTSDFFLVYTIAALSLRIIGRRLPDRLGVRRLLPPAFAVLFIGLGLIGAAEDVWTLRLAGFLCGLGHGYVFPLLNALIVDRTPEGARGIGVSVFTALVDVGVLVAGPLLGQVAARWGYATMFTASAVGVGLVALLLVAGEIGRLARRPSAG